MDCNQVTLVKVGPHWGSSERMLDCMLNAQVKVHTQGKVHMLTFLEIQMIPVVDSKQANNQETIRLHHLPLKVKILVLLVSCHFPFQVTTVLPHTLGLRLLSKESFLESFRPVLKEMVLS